MTSIELKAHQFFCACLCFLIVGSAIAFSLFYAGHALGMAIKYQADREVVIAVHGEQEARYKALNALLSLEALRTNVEKANQKALMAEYRLQTLCKKSKLKC